MHGFHWKLRRKGLLEVKRLWKFRFLGSFSIAKTEEYDLKLWNVFDQFGITMPCSATYFLEVGARVLLKVWKKPPKGLLEIKKTLKNRIFRLFFQSQNGRVRPKSLNYLSSIWHHYSLFNYIFSGRWCTPFVQSFHEKVY